MSRRNKVSFIALACITILSACSSPSPPTRFYLLHPVVSPAEKYNNEIAIGIGPVELADYLNRPQIVTNANGVEVSIAEFDHWAGSLKENVIQVMAESLAELLATERIEIDPRRSGAKVDYRVAITILRFHGRRSAETRITAFWTLYGPERGAALLKKISDIREPVTKEGYSGLTEANSRALGRLCDEIATVIRAQID